MTASSEKDELMLFEDTPRPVETEPSALHLLIAVSNGMHGVQCHTNWICVGTLRDDEAGCTHVWFDRDDVAERTPQTELKYAVRIERVA